MTVLLHDGRPPPWGGTGSRRWAWHRLSSRWAERIVRHAGITAGDLVLDVGAGSRRAARAVGASGRTGHRRRAPPRSRPLQLERRFAYRDVRVVGADAADLRLPRRPFKVVANPPFTVTVALLKRLLAPGSHGWCRPTSCSPATPAALGRGPRTGARRYKATTT